MKPLVIFDMDGTLVNSANIMTNSVNYVRKHLGLEPVETTMLTYYINTPGENLAMRFYETQTYLPEHRELFKEHYIENCDKGLELYDGVKEALEELAVHVEMAIATNASKCFAQKMITSCEIDKYFKMIVGADTVGGISKPDPTMIQYIMKNLNTSPKKSLLVGDSQKDELAAKNAKTNFLYVKWGYGGYEPKKSYTCKDSNELAKYVKDIIL